MYSEQAPQLTTEPEEEIQSARKLVATDASEASVKYKQTTPEIASATERLLHYKIAPELLSNEGRISVLVLYLLMILAAGWGCS